MVVAEAVHPADRLLGVFLVVEADEGEPLGEAGHLVLGQVGARQPAERSKQVLQVGLARALRQVGDADRGVVVCGETSEMSRAYTMYVARGQHATCATG